MVKRQIEGSNDDEILQHTWKAAKTRNPMKQESNNLVLRLGRNPCFKISKNQQKFERK